PDSGLGHDGDGDGLDDLGDQFRIAHPGHTALGADIGGDAFERHHRHGTGIFGDLGLLGGDHIHDHPTLEHVCHTAFDRGGATGGYRRFAGDWGVLGHWGPRQSLDNVTSLLPRGGAAAAGWPRISADGLVGSAPVGRAWHVSTGGTCRVSTGGTWHGRRSRVAARWPPTVPAPSQDRSSCGDIPADAGTPGGWPRTGRYASHRGPPHRR